MDKNRWARLSQSEKAELLGIYTAHGYNDLANIIADYNTYADGGDTNNPNEIRPGESISEWKKRIKKQNATQEIDGGKIAPSVKYATPSTKKGRYLKEKKLRSRVGMVASDTAEDMIRDFEDAISGIFISDPDIALSLREAAEYLPHPNAGEREAMYKATKSQYLDSLHPGNDIFSQVYRYYRRHKKKNQNSSSVDGASFSGIGADIVSLDNNVVRLTPTSKQSNALVNEFVESKYPSVLQAKEYKENPDRIVGDRQKFPASNIHYYAGIEDGKFRIDKLENFNDETTVIPARNIKSDVPEIYGIRIDGLNDNGSNSNGTIRDTGYLSNINNRLWDNTIMQLESDAFDKYLEQRGIDANQYEKAIDDNIQKYVDGNEVVPGQYNVPYYIYSGKKLSDMSLLEKAEIDWDRNYSDPMLNLLKPKGGWPEDYIVRVIDPLSIGYYDTDKYETEELKNVRKRNAPLEQFKNDRYDFIARAGNTFLNEGGSEPSKYGFVDKDGNLHSISEYHADVLDGKTIIGNPNGSIFIGRLQDISRPQLDSLNNYLAKNPSRILRTDLGSFNQYRLDNPSLDSYLRQYYEHPRATDPNVYVVGTTTPNTLWSNEKKHGGSIHIKPENRGKFTALKKRTGHSASWFKAHGTPAQKKMAVFALNARKWKHDDGGPIGVTPLGGDLLEYLQATPEVYLGQIEPSVITAKLPSKFNGSQVAAQRYAEGYLKGSKPVSEAMNRAGRNIFNTVDTVIGLTPTPAGAISWLGHMGADVAEGEYGKVGKDLAMAAAMGLGLKAVGKGAAYLKNYWDEIGNFGEDIFRAFTDNIPGRVSTNVPPELFNIGHATAPAEAFIAERAAPTVEKAVSAPYEIENLGGGYMLKSLMHGNPLEKQIGKNGTVNVNNVRALVSKGSKVEQAIVNKVLASEEFAGKKAIDYNKFRNAVQNELITYKRSNNWIGNQAYADYGMERIGFEVEPDEASSSLPGFVKGAKTDVVLYESPRIPDGSARHYNDNTLGHSRTYITADEPDVLHVMESQSDWAQSYKPIGHGGVGGYAHTAEYNDKRITALKKRIERLNKDIKDEELRLSTSKRIDGTTIENEWEKQQLREIIERDKKDLESARNELYIRQTPSEAMQHDYLANNYTSRQIQENLRYAAEKGRTKMRYPTRETAAKIEGYPEREAYFNEKGEEISIIRNKSQEVSEQVVSLYTFGEEADKEIAELQAGVKKYDNLISQWDSIPPEDILEDLTMRENERQWESYCSYLKHASKQPRASFHDYERYENEASMFEKKFGHKPNTDKDVAEIEEALRESNRMHSRLLELSKGEAELRPSITKKTVYDYEDILRKYTEFPKQYKKLFKGADVRIITDPKGNTWYEVDVPENYLNQEWQYKYGGKLNKFANISSIF